MTREEAIDKLNVVANYIGNPAKSEIIEAIKTINYSWISAKDDLPCNHKELVLYESRTKPVLVIDNEGVVGIVGMQKRNNGIIGVEPWWQWEIPSVINYWMKIPEAPKE